MEKPSNSRMSVDSGYFVFHYMIDTDVCYLTLTEKSYPKKLAYQYLEELQSEFVNLYGPQIQTVSRPYAFIKFGERSHPQSIPESVPCPHVSHYMIWQLGPRLLAHRAA